MIPAMTPCCLSWSASGATPEPVKYENTHVETEEQEITRREGGDVLLQSVTGLAPVGRDTLMVVLVSRVGHPPQRFLDHCVCIVTERPR